MTARRGQVHQDVPGAGCPATPCNCSVVYRTEDQGDSWSQTAFEPWSAAHPRTEGPLVAPLLRKDGRLVSLWQLGNRLQLDPSDPTNRTLRSPNAAWLDTGSELQLESVSSAKISGVPIAPGPGGESSMDTPMVMYQASELSQRNGGGHILTMCELPRPSPRPCPAAYHLRTSSADGFATNRSATRGCLGEAQDETPGKRWWCYTTFIAHSEDEGESWQYRGRIDWTGEKAAIEGPCEAETVELRNGRLFNLMRVASNYSLFQSFSDDAGRTWTAPAATPMWSVAPRVLAMPNGALVATGSRPATGLWVSADGAGAEWRFWNADEQHNLRAASSQARFPAADAAVRHCNDSAHCDPTHPINDWPGQWPGPSPARSGYNGLQALPCSPTSSNSNCSVLLIYDLLECGWGGCPNGSPKHDWVFSMRVSVAV